MDPSQQAEDADVPVVIGRIRGPYGVRGWVHLASFTDPADNLLEYGPWLLHEGGRWQRLQVQGARAHGKGYVAQLQGCDDRDAAAALAGRDIAVMRSQLPPPAEDEFYWRDLIGLRVETLEGVALGSVAQMMATGANDVLVVRDADRERLIPFIGQVVVTVDLEAGIMRVDWDPEF